MIQDPTVDQHQLITLWENHIIINHKHMIFIIIIKQMKPLSTPCN